MDFPARLRALLAAALLLLPVAAAAEVAVPPLQSRVTDLTGTLDRAQAAALEQQLAAFEARKGAQVAVLLVPSTQPETVEQYAVRVFERWRLGRKGVDDGVLLLVAKDDRRLRIEVGYGLEGVLPDAVARRIVADDIAPRFRQGDFAGGVRAGVARILGVIDGEPLPPPRAAAGAAGQDVESLLVLCFVAVVFFGGLLRALFGRALAAGIVGGVIGFVAWVVSGLFAVGLLAAGVAFLLMLAGGGGGRWGGTTGGWSSGGGGFGSGSGGGFSGGGGSSGGGGASGSW